MLTWILLARIAAITTLPLLVLPGLPSPFTIVVLLLSGVCLLALSHRRIRIAGVALLFTAWGLFNAQSLVKDTEMMIAARGSLMCKLRTSIRRIRASESDC